MASAVAGVSSSSTLSLSSPSLGSLATTSPGSGSKDKETRFNRLLTRLNSRSPSASASAYGVSTMDPATPMRYSAAAASSSTSMLVPPSPAISEPDVRPPVFASQFMREYEAAAGAAAIDAVSSSSPRPSLGTPSHSSPAGIPSVSPSGNNSGSLKSRLVRVASSSSLFGRSAAPNHNNPHVIAGSPTAASPVHHGHRKTTSLAVGGTPSPRARLAASIAGNGLGHKHRHSEDVRHLYLPTDSAKSDNSNEPAPLSPRLRSILGNKDGNAASIASNDKWQKSKESLLGLGSLGRKRSMDGLSSVNGSASIQEEREDEPTQVEERPSLGARLYSHDRTAEVSNAPSSYALKSTPAFPRVPLNPSSTLAASTSGHTGISSGLSESSRRFRSAFRLNKARATPGPPGASDAPGTGGLSVRRAMRVPLSQQQQEEAEREEEERSNAMLSRADASEASASANEKSPDDAQASMRSTSTGMSSLHNASPPLVTADRDSAHERAQLVPSLPSVAEYDSRTHTRQVSAQATSLGASLRARRAAPGASSSPELGSHAEEDRQRSSRGNSPDFDQENAPARNAKHTRSTSSRAKLEDLMLVPDVPQAERARSPPIVSQSIPRSESLQSVGSEPDSDTLRAIEQQQQRRPASRQALRSRDERADEVELLVDQNSEQEKENPGRAAPAREKGRLPIFSDATDKENDGRYSPPILGKRRGEEGRPVLGEVRRPLQPAQSMPQQQQQQQSGLQPRLGKLSSSSSNGGLGYHPNDRQVLVNDYAVPTKRGGDTPPDSHAPYHPHHQAQQQYAQQPQYQPQQFPSMQPVRSAPALPPPSSSLPPLPMPAEQPQQQKRPTGTVTVKGKTYTRMGLLGRGGSSKVFRVRDAEHNVYALKKVDLGRGADGETYQSFLNEIELLERLRGHDRIIQLVSSEVNEPRRSLIMVMEIGEIDLNALLQERSGKRVSMNFVRHTWEQMLEAVAVIHEEGIVHTDLKPANFVLVKGALKLIDFGIAKAIPNDTTNIARDQQIGTANYMSPEALSPHVSNGPRGERVMKLGRPSDVWSLGCILYQIVYGHTPFGRIKNLAAKMAAIQSPTHIIDFPSHSVPCTLKGEPLPDLAVKVEDDLLKCMRACLRFDSKRRATIPELLEDPFLRREGGAPVERETDATVGPDLMGAIVGKTLQWSQGRLPSRGEQERFVEALVRQLQQAQAGQR